ncbi:hypothetical protein BH11BAC4_BH11BAC4_26940 [soil metagenome]
MPQSKKRKPHQHPHDYIPHKKKRKSAVPVAMGFCMILGLGIAWFAAGPSIPGLLAGIAGGAIVGWVAGKQMDKAFK